MSTSKGPNLNTLTPEQLLAIETLKTKWHKIGEPSPLLFSQGAVVIQCFYNTGGSMWIVIETDGYTHS